MKNIFNALICLVFTNLIWAQGCSDAGICSISKGFQTESVQFKNNFDVATIYSLGEANVKYYSHYISYTKKINEQFAYTSKITLSTANGEFGTRTQFGDVFLISNYTFKEKAKKQWGALFGLKFPLTASNLKINNYSLPLDYQSSLGTIDLFLGTNLDYKNWAFNGVIQIPIINLNKNSYFKEYAGTNDYPSTNLFKRKSDALFRTTYTVKTSNQKIIFKPNILFIYHLGEDSYETIFGKRENIAGSDGLTINGNLITAYNFNKQNSIELSVAAPFKVRTIRPDGLTRSFVLGLQYRILF